MNAINPVGPQAGMGNKSIAQSGEAQIRITSEPGAAADADIAQFRAALERHTQGGVSGAVHGSNGVNGTGSLGEKLAARTIGLSGELQKARQYVSKLLEQANPDRRLDAPDEGDDGIERLPDPGADDFDDGIESDFSA